MYNEKKLEKKFGLWALLYTKQGITNTLTLPIDKMLYLYFLCPQSEHQNNPCQSKQSKHFNEKNQFNKYETGFNKVKLPKVGSNAIVPVPVGAGPNYCPNSMCNCCQTHSMYSMGGRNVMMKAHEKGKGMLVKTQE